MQLHHLEANFVIASLSLNRLKLELSLLLQQEHLIQSVNEGVNSLNFFFRDRASFQQFSSSGDESRTEIGEVAEITTCSLLP